VAVVGELLAVTALLLFSANVVLVGAATRRVPQDLGFLLGLVGNVVVAGLVAAGQLALGGRLPPPEWDAVALFAVGGVLTAFVGRWFFFRSVTTLGPTRASTVQVSNPVFAALAAWTLLGEALPPGAVLFAGTVLAGLYLTSRQTGAAGAGTDTGPVPLGEVGLALLGAVAYGLGNVARGASVRDWPVPVVGGLVEAAAALAVYATLNTDLRTIGAAVRGADPAGRRLWLGSGVLTITAQTCLIAASLSIPIAVAVVITAALPIVVLPVSVLFLRRTEGLGVSAGVGAVLVLVGVAGLVLG
jgi:drug/metabolite transporter (DMT)-like permease